MAKSEEVPLDPEAWLRDEQLSFCSPAARGIWMDLCCQMYRTGAPRLSGTPEQLARIARCSPAEMTSALAELKVTGAAEIQEGAPGIFTAGSRRIARRLAGLAGKRERRARAATQRPLFGVLKGDEIEAAEVPTACPSAAISESANGNIERSHGAAPQPRDGRAAPVSALSLASSDSGSSLLSEASEEDLHGRKAARAGDPIKRDADQLCAHYRALWVERFDPGGSPPEIATADFLATRKIVQRFGLDRAKELVEIFLADPDPFLAKRGHRLRDLNGDACRARAGPYGPGTTMRNGRPQHIAPSEGPAETQDQSEELRRK